MINNNKETVFHHSISRRESSDISSLANSPTAMDKNSPELQRQEQRTMVSNNGIKISMEKRSSSATWPSLELGTSGSRALSFVSSQSSTTKKVSYY